MEMAVDMSSIIDRLQTVIGDNVGHDEVHVSDIQQLVQELLVGHIYATSATRAFFEDPLDGLEHFNLSRDLINFIRAESEAFFNQVVRHTIVGIDPNQYVAVNWVTPSSISISQTRGEYQDSDLNGMELDKRYS